MHFELFTHSESMMQCLSQAETLHLITALVKQTRIQFTHLHHAPRHAAETLDLENIQNIL